MTDLIPKEAIFILRAAIQGDDEAQKSLLNLFDSYINSIATVTIYSEGGVSKTYLDEDIKIQIQAKLLKSLETFDLDGIFARQEELSVAPRNTEERE